MRAPMVSFEPFPTLETERLTLRRLMPDDAAWLLRLQQDPEVVRYLGRDPDATLEQASARLERVDSTIREGAGITWGIVLRETGALIGNAGLWRWVKQHHYAEVGYQLETAYWGRGLMTEAMRTVVRFGFEVMALHRVEGLIDPANVGSARVLEKLGFKQEARLRENWFYNGTYTDSAIYGLLRGETELL